ncbi:DUF6708 domain-containing protein [Luteimonas sp. A501]
MNTETRNVQTEVQAEVGLSPPNSQAVLLLPLPSEPAGKVARTWDGVMRVYPNALALVDQLGAIRGYLSAFGILAAPLGAMILYADFSRGSFVWGIIFLPFWLLTLVFIQIDWVGFRYAPVLVNRALGKVHVFVDKGLPWWQWGWKLWGRTRFEVQSYDWSCVRGEVVQYTIFTGQVPRRESGLVFAVTDAPGSATVLQRFGVGPSIGYGDLESPVERWEHIRRFMQGEGPAWTVYDRLYEDFGVGFWESFWLFQPLFGPGSEESRRHGPGMWLLGIAALPFLPLTAYMGLVRYLSFRMKREPAWSPEVQASLGGPPLTDAQLQDIALKEG